jgi:hypothetical protein
LSGWTARAADALRARVTFDRIAIAVVLIGGVLLVASLVQGSEDGAATDRAADLVPANALVYVHVHVDPNSEQWRRANEIVLQLPGLRRLRDRALDSLSRGRRPFDFERQVRPWIGDEAALALLPDGRRATSLILVRVADQVGARRFLAGAGEPREQRHRGVTVRRYGDLATAFVGEFLAIGELDNVRAAVDAGGRESLAREPGYRTAVERLELDDPLAYAYAPASGVTQVLRSQGGLLGQLRSLLEVPGLRAAAAAVRAEQQGIRISTVSLTSPSAAAAKEQFHPTLIAEVPADTIAYLGASGPDGLFEQLERLGGGAESPLPRLVERLRRPLGRAGERALARALRPLLDRESALIVTPPVRLPIVSLVVAGTSAAEGGEVLVALQPAIARLLEDPSLGQVPTLQQRRIDGVDATSLRLSPTLELTYAAFENMLVVSTSAEGIRQIRATDYSLEQNAAFAPRLRDFLQRASSVVFLDLRRLTALIERAGLAATPTYRAIEPDIARFGAVSGVTANARSSQTAEIFVEVP